MVDKSFMDSVRGKLEKAFPGAIIDLEDQSHRHAGHAGHDPRGGSHLRLKIGHPTLWRAGRLDRHRLIHRVLAEDMATRIHALAIEILPENS